MRTDLFRFVSFPFRFRFHSGFYNLPYSPKPAKPNQNPYLMIIHNRQLSITSTAANELTLMICIINYTRSVLQTIDPSYIMNNLTKKNNYHARSSYYDDDQGSKPLNEELLDISHHYTESQHTSLIHSKDRGS